MPTGTAGTNLVAEQYSLTSGPWVWLVEFELSASEKMRLAANTADVTFLSQTWRAFPFEVARLEERNDGELTVVTLVAADPSGVIRSEIDKADGLSDAPCTVYLVPTDLAASPTDGSGNKNYLTWTGEVEAVNYPPQAVTIQVGGASLLRFAAPRGVVTRGACPYIFKDSATCQYSGSGTFCDKSLDGPQGCNFYDNVINYGGAPFVPKLPQ